MRLNRSGMTALVDAMVFMLVMTIVVSLSVHSVIGNSYVGPDAGSSLDCICGVEVRVSDMTDLDDDSLVYLTDIMAYHVARGSGDDERSQLTGYLESVLNRQFGGRAYDLTMSYDGKTMDVGRDVRDTCSEAHRELQTSLGGVLTLDLRIAS